MPVPPRALAAVAALVAAISAAAASVAAVPAAATPATTRPDVILSNETTFTTWTIANVDIRARARPVSNARPIARLLTSTPDGDLQTYIVLRERWTPTGPWVKIRLPGRPNGRVGWVPRGVLNAFQVTHVAVVVDRADRTLTVYRQGKVVYRFPVGVGKPSTPTPRGHFWITEAGNFLADPFYGPYAFATSDYSTLSEWPHGGVVGIHGTNEPQLIPGDPSHGCIRMLNKDILKLVGLVRVGTPLRVI